MPIGYGNESSRIIIKTVGGVVLDGQVIDAFDYAQHVAKEIGELLSAHLYQPEDELSNTAKDVKVKQDLWSEQHIRAMLQSRFSWAILGEELGCSEVEQRAMERDFYWVVDPLDGTVNYSRGIPFFAVSIGLWHGNDPVFGVVYDVYHRTMYAGRVGAGATKNGQELKVSSVQSRTKAVICTGFPAAHHFQVDQMNNYFKEIFEFQKVRMIGSASLSLALVASGSADAYWEEHIRFWDVAAGLALVKAAGGAISFVPHLHMKWTMTVHAAASEKLFGEVMMHDPL